MLFRSNIINESNDEVRHLESIYHTTHKITVRKRHTSQRRSKLGEVTLRLKIQVKRDDVLEQNVFNVDERFPVLGAILVFEHVGEET